MVRSYPGYGDRAAVLREAQRQKMARSAHAYVRGSTARFYQWLEKSSGAVPDGPAIWICGDCHSSNLGPVADASGKVAIQIRDLDQTVIGNPAHDLLRLGLSLAMAARGSNLPGVITALMVEQLVEGYQAAIAEEPGSGQSAEPMPKAVQRALRSALRRRWKHLAEERIEDARPAIPLGKHFWPLNKAERKAIMALGDDEDVRQLVTALHHRPSGAAVEILDAAYWLKGCSSLGRLRYAVLVGLGEWNGERGEPGLLDIKEAAPAAAPRASGAVMPKDNAERVVAGARALSPFLGERMLPVRLLDRSVVIRELTPQDLKLELESLTQDEALKAARYLAGVVGRAHGRQLDDAARASWLKELRRNRSRTLDAPSWLWSSLVELVTSHEAAYLDHCRRYALDSAA